MPLIKEIRALGASRSEPGAGRPRGDGEWRLVVLDNGRRLRVDAERVARYGLEQGEPIDPRVLVRLVADDTHRRARESALRLLSIRPRSTSEIGESLARHRVPKAAIRAVVDDLTAEGLLDDLAFARAWVARRTSRSQYGSRRIRWELRQKGVSSATIDLVLGESRGAGNEVAGSGGAIPGEVAQSEAASSGMIRDEEQRAQALIRARARRYQSLPPDRRARRIAALLERRGFAPATIVRVLRSLGGEGKGERADRPESAGSAEPRDG